MYGDSTMNVSTDGIVQEELTDSEISALIDRTERFLQVEGLNLKGNDEHWPKKPLAHGGKQTDAMGHFGTEVRAWNVSLSFLNAGVAFLGNVTAR